MLTTAVILIGIALIFEFVNGFHDSSNIVATIINFRAMSPRKALLLAAIAEFLGPFIFGTAVATTIGSGIVDLKIINISVIFSALIGAIIWNLITWHFGIPSSSSHALIGGLIGSVAISAGIDKIHSGGVLKIVLVLFTSPLIGAFFGFLITKITMHFTRNATPHINEVFKKSQIISSIALALSHGANDAQKTMGIITMSLVILGFQTVFVVPIWVILVCALCMALGIASGGWRIIKTVGNKIFRIRPIDGFNAQLASSAVILSAALIGGPVSTTHVVSSSIIGVGTGVSPSKVRWLVVNDIITAWVITLPISALISALVYLLINYVLN